MRPALRELFTPRRTVGLRRFSLLVIVSSLEATIQAPRGGTFGRERDVHTVQGRVGYRIPRRQNVLDQNA